jgi:hypothetical protein
METLLLCQNCAQTIARAAQTALDGISCERILPTKAVGISLKNEDLANPLYKRFTLLSIILGRTKSIYGEHLLSNSLKNAAVLTPKFSRMFLDANFPG